MGKAIIQQISDPLVPLIRNTVNQGIEPAPKVERQASRRRIVLDA